MSFKEPQKQEIISIVREEFWLPTRKGLIVASACGLAAAIGTLKISAMVASQKVAEVIATQSVRTTIDEITGLKATAEEGTRRISDELNGIPKLPEDIAALQLKVAAMIPVGSVLAYTGRWDNEIEQKVQDSGWLPCDGRVINCERFAALCSILPETQELEGHKGAKITPNYQGYFLRGAPLGAQAGELEKTDVLRKHAHMIGGDKGDQRPLQVGILREKDLKTEKTRTPTFDGFDQAGYIFVQDTFVVPGETMSAGDGDETRPKNWTVLWLIRAE